MNLNLTVYTAYCSPKVFTINGTEADAEDFGEQYDHSPGVWGCGDMRFDARPATEEILQKYRITPDEYAQVCERLKKELSFGRCSQCV